MVQWTESLLKIKIALTSFVKCLGVNTVIIIAHNHLNFFRKLKSFNEPIELLKLFYNSVIGSTMMFGLVCWGGNIPKQDTHKLNKTKQKNQEG